MARLIDRDSGLECVHSSHFLSKGIRGFRDLAKLNEARARLQGLSAKVNSVHRRQGQRTWPARRRRSHRPARRQGNSRRSDPRRRGTRLRSQPRISGGRVLLRGRAKVARHGQWPPVLEHSARQGTFDLRLNIFTPSPARVRRLAHHRNRNPQWADVGRAVKFKTKAARQYAEEIVGDEKAPVGFPRGEDRRVDVHQRGPGPGR